MHQYLSIVLTLVGALVGFVGKPWDDTRPGLLKFTTRGWISVGILVIGTASSLFAVHRASEKAAFEAHQRRMVKQLAYADIRFQLERLACPFVSLAIDTTAEPRRFPIESLGSPAAAQRIASADVYSAPALDFGFDDTSYFTIFQRVAKAAPEGLKETIRTYSPWIDGEDIVSLRAIADDPFLGYLENLPDNRATTGVLHAFQNDDEIAWYSAFMGKVIPLYTRVTAGSDEGGMC
ncbi:MAG TPA: hypothetical protein VFQ45_16100 [Longimicrobium sp.]|nr:hypothetical protein [Longimicrobium sp.]